MDAQLLRTRQKKRKIQMDHYHAPTDSISGIYPSLKLRSRRLTSSIDVALAIAALTFSASSFDIKRPAFPMSGVIFGSSVVMTALDDCVDTVVDNVVARAVGRFSAVTNSAFPACRSWRGPGLQLRNPFEQDGLKSPGKPLAIPFFFPHGVPH